MLCQVWSLRVDVHILDHNGNLADAASLSALAALLAFRRPEVTLEAGGVGVGEGQQVVVHPPDVREPLPLSIHHTPLAVTFASFQVSTMYVVECVPHASLSWDPTHHWYSTSCSCSGLGLNVLQ